MKANKPNELAKINEQYNALDLAIEAIKNSKDLLKKQFIKLATTCDHLVDGKRKILVSVYYEDKHHSAWSADWDGRGEVPIKNPNMLPTERYYGCDKTLRARCAYCGKVLLEKSLKSVENYREFLAEAHGDSTEENGIREHIDYYPGTIKGNDIWMTKY